jgi:hypothetical protein
MISNREGARHGSASGVGGANGPEQAEAKCKASTSQRPAGAPPAVVAEQTGRLLAEREREWLERLTTDPASFASVELEIHEQARRQADFYVAGLLAKASEQSATAPHIDKVISEAEVPLRPVEKKDGPWWSASWAGWRSR